MKKNGSTRMSATALLLASLCQLSIVHGHGIPPAFGINAQPEFGEPYSFLASRGSFGADPPMQGVDTVETKLLVLPPSENSKLCVTVTEAEYKDTNADAILLVPRGGCTFENKAKNAQTYGYSAIVIYGTLGSRYTLNETKYTNRTDWDGTYTTDDIVYPQNKSDYDCDKGSAYVETSSLSFSSLPYNAQQNDPILSGWDPTTNMCLANSPDHLESCPSKACLLTGEFADNEKKTLKACCAWDLYVWLYADPQFNDAEVVIPSAYVTMEQGQSLLRDAQNGKLQIQLYSRYRPAYNSSVGLIWFLGVAVCAVAAYMSASDYRNATNHVLASRNGRMGTSSENNNDESTSTAQDQRSPRSRSPASLPSRNRHQENISTTEMPSTYQKQDNTESLELGAEHAFGFIFMASTGLMVLFFFKIYNIVKIMYAFGCSGGVLQVIALPLMEKISRRFKIRDKICFRTDVLGIGQVSYFEMLAVILAYGLGLSWILVAFFTTDPNSYTFFWVTQDIMGACMCIMFLSLIKLNSIRVASLLLTIAFLYDIFFVFITPMIFNGDSVMITVATSGGAPKADPSWCEKYPDDKDCLGGDPLPMLFTIPRFFDYQGGASLLGLGDIVLPGLLLSFAARLDAAKHLVGLMVGGRGISHSNTCPEGRKCFGSCTCMGLFNGGYFGPLVVAYGIGLLMANVAVYKFQMGQPALLYLVPCCLGTMVYMGWRRNELNQMWEGARTIKAADKLVYGEEEGQDGSMMPLPTDEESEFASVPSALDKQ